MNIVEQATGIVRHAADMYGLLNYYVDAGVLFEKALGMALTPGQLMVVCDVATRRSTSFSTFGEYHARRHRGEADVPEPDDADARAYVELRLISAKRENFDYLYGVKWEGKPTGVLACRDPLVEGLGKYGGCAGLINYNAASDLLMRRK